MLKRLYEGWVYGGFLAGILLLVLLPAMSLLWAPSLVAVFLCLPIYMLHQYEEHDNDRFRIFVNTAMGRGKEVLSPRAVFIVNVPDVWGVIAVSFTLADVVNLGAGLIAVYLVLVNGIVHILHAVIFRKYNPGLVTAIVLFLPLSAYALQTIQRAGGGATEMHITGLLIALAIHAALVLYANRRL
jgi:hypothetical protein